MENLVVVPDEVLEMVQETDPEFPLCTVDCVSWKLEHPDCRGCPHLQRCKDFVLGMEVGTIRLLRKFAGIRT